MPIDFTEPAALVQLMMAEAKPIELGNWGDVVALYASRLAEVAPKLNEDEMWRLIAIGAAMCQRGYREFEAGVVGGELLEQLRKAARSGDGDA